MKTLTAYLREKYNPDVRALTMAASTSAFILMMFLTTPDYANPYYVFGLAATIFCLVAAVVMVTLELWKQ